MVENEMLFKIGAPETIIRSRKLWVKAFIFGAAACIGWSANGHQCLVEAFADSRKYPKRSLRSNVPMPGEPSLPLRFSKKSEESSAMERERLLDSLNTWIEKAPKNGIDTPADIALKIHEICQQLEAMTPHPTPTRSTNLLNGFWRMLWTDYSPAGPSSGKLGPFVGDVYQDLDLQTDSIARNIFRLDSPIPIVGELTATPSIHDDKTVAIAFVKVGTKIAGFLPFGPNIKFEENKEIRLWDHCYVDENYRILYARNAVNEGNEQSRGFLYVMRRADEDQFSTSM